MTPSEYSFSPGDHSQFLEHPAHVCLDRRQRYSEFISNLLIGFAAQHVSEYIDLPRRQAW